MGLSPQYLLFDQRYDFRGRTLLVGNGLNRCLQEDYSWKKVLDSISAQAKIQPPSGSQFPLEFEKMARQFAETQEEYANPFDELKRIVCKSIQDIDFKPGELHESLLGIPCESVITTNYDYNLERTWGRSFWELPKPREQYLRHRTSVINGVSFYHPHGIVTKPASLCLGYQRYASYIAKLHEELVSTKSGSVDNEALGNINQRIDLLLMGYDEPSTWEELFLCNDVAILGFGLDFCEIDFWWLISLRSFWQINKRDSSIALPDNEIFFYDCCETGSDEHDRSNQLRRNELLQDLGVKVDVITADSYERAYLKAIDEIRKRWDKPSR